MTLREAVKAFMAKTNTDLDTLLGDAQLVKAADAMGESREITDTFQQGQKHATITSEDVKTGGPLAAVGSNTQRMNGMYSNNAPQMGPELDAEKLLSALGLMSATMKAGFDRHGAAIDALIAAQKSANTFIASLVKAEEDDEETKKAAAAKAEDEAKDDMTEKAKSTGAAQLLKAESYLKRAKALLKAADEMDEDEDKEEMKSAKAKVRVLRKAAVTLLSKARRNAYIAGDLTLKKSVIDAAAKGEAEFMEDEDLEKAESCSDDDVEKALAAVATKKSDDAGNQADKQDKTNGDQAATTAKAVADAVAGLAVLHKTVADLVDMVGGQSKIVPVVTKGGTDTIDASTIYEKIMYAEDEGTLTSAQGVEATSLANSLDAVAKGDLAKGVWESRLQAAPTAVRALFAEAA